MISLINSSQSHPPLNSSIACSFCGKFYKGKHGIAIHVSRAHPTEHRDAIVNRQRTWISDSTKKKHSLSTSLPIPSEVNPPMQSDSSHIVDNPQSQNLTCDDLKYYKSEMLKWKNEFSTNSFSDDEFYVKIEGFSKFLADAIYLLPGPKHPAAKFYSYRRKKRTINIQRQYSQSSNPERATKRDKEKRRAKYEYQRTQFLYYNQRRKAIQFVMKNKYEKCKIDIQKIHHHFQTRFSPPNYFKRSEYNTGIQTTNESTPHFDESPITKSEVAEAIKGIAVDTAPGPDKVLVRVLKDETCYEILAIIASRMLYNTLVPPCFQKAKTVLIYKGGDHNDPSNWRPITICSVLRRIIERILDRRLRQYVQFSEFQRGFINSPGALTNISLLQSILQSTKIHKSNVTLVFLDVQRAFDNIGHCHLQNTLNALPIPSKLTSLILKLQEGNTTQIEVQNTKTKPIPLNRGVMQGSPLSPALYNLATDHILEEVSHEEILENHGFSLIQGLPNLSVMGFADDILLIGKNDQSAAHLTEIVISRLKEIGLETNVNKCKCLSIVNGTLTQKSLTLKSGDEISSVDVHEPIKYLGVSFYDSTIFDSKRTMDNLRTKLDILTASPLLQPFQKFYVLCSAICPSLIYTFQTTPLQKIPSKFLADADILIKSALKEILNLPTDTPDNMLYTEKKFKGLGLFCVRWEAFLQHINSCKKLLSIKNMYINNTRNLTGEAEQCMKLLNITTENESLFNVRKIRTQLRREEYDHWSSLPSKGKGVVLYKEFTPANKWISKPDGLTSGEWREALKMTANVCVVRAVPLGLRTTTVVSVASTRLKPLPTSWDLAHSARLSATPDITEFVH